MPKAPVGVGLRVSKKVGRIEAVAPPILQPINTKVMTRVNRAGGVFSVVRLKTILRTTL